MELITKNKGALDFLHDNGTVEVTCSIGKDGISPLRFGEIPMHQKTLITQMKAYENMAVEAILGRDKQLAVVALMTNPLVNSYTLAKRLLDSYLHAHAEYLSHWL